MEGFLLYGYLFVMRELIRKVLKESVEGYDKIIQEGKQVGTLYHYTSLGAANSILKDGFIKGGESSLAGYHDSMRGDNNFSLSFTRNKNFHRQNRVLGEEVECRFVIDGDSLSNIYKIQPITNTDSSVMSFKKQSVDFEYEEVILSQNPIKVPINPYVIRIDFLIEPIEGSQWGYLDTYKFIGTLKKQGIPTNMVDKNGNPAPKELKASFGQWIKNQIMNLGKVLD